MRTDDPFERLEPELRSTLRHLAAEPAPDWLVDRVTAIPATSSVGTGRSILRFAGTLLAAAIVVTALGAALVAGPLGGLPIGPGPANPTASPSVSPSTAPSASPAPSTSPSLSASPSVSPSPPPAPSAAVSGFDAVSVTFVSPDLGWALGTAPCTVSPCTYLERTQDGGRTWGLPLQGPPTPVVIGGTAPVTAAGSGVSKLRFADPLDGWAFGPDLWVTHDGGASWHRLAVPGGSGARVVALEAAAGTVHAVIADDAGFRIASSPVGSDAWRLAAITLPYGAGPVPDAQLVLSHGGGWVIQVDRTVLNGARLVGGAWTSWTPPCVDALGPAVLAASSASDLVAACDGGVWGPPADPAAAGEHLFVSHDGGTTFSETGSTVPLQTASGITSSSPQVVLVAGGAPAAGGAEQPAIVGSFDGGRTWSTVLSVSTDLTDLGFTTTTQGVAIALNDPRTGGLFMTRDGGHTWSAVSFSGG